MRVLLEAREGPHVVNAALDALLKSGSLVGPGDDDNHLARLMVSDAYPEILFSWGGGKSVHPAQFGRPRSGPSWAPGPSHCQRIESWRQWCRMPASSPGYET